MRFGRFRALALALVVGPFAAACSHLAPLPAATPELPLEPWERDAAALEKPPAGAVAPSPPSADDPASSLAKSQVSAASKPRAASSPSASRSRPRPNGAAPTRHPRPTTRSSVVGGAGCLAELATRGVRYSRSESVLGVATPVVIEGPIAGVRFYTHEKKPFVLDCRLALALSEIAEDLRALGVSQVRYSGAYVYRTSRPGRMSLHAYGLAIDLHEFEVKGQRLLVKTAFARGKACGEALPLLNELACRVRERALFHEQIGPDDNAAHHDHFHFGIRPLPGEVSADLPWPSSPSPRKRASRAAPNRKGWLPELAPKRAQSQRATPKRDRTTRSVNAARR